MRRICANGTCATVMFSFIIELGIGNILFLNFLKLNIMSILDEVIKIKKTLKFITNFKQKILSYGKFHEFSENNLFEVKFWYNFFQH